MTINLGQFLDAVASYSRDLPLAVKQTSSTITKSGETGLSVVTGCALVEGRAVVIAGGPVVPVPASVTGAE